MSAPTPDPSPVSGFSFPYGIPLVAYPILFYGAYRGAGHWWAWGVHGLFLLAVAAFAWEALSRKDYEKIRAKDPSLTRLTWALNYLLFFVLGPLAVWAVIFGPRLLGF